ncbi:alpha/beta fold hydrolase [Candidatus Gottesmanbacteria bacterium]|nr:alpha/beta fold hydrolase [Candidatus Gottesmanbacteria bacterium]
MNDPLQPETDQTYQFTPHYKKAKKIIIFAAVLIALSVIGGVYFLILSTKNQYALTSFTQISTFTPTSIPTPFPFRDITIPYLRERSYQSSLGDLEKISESGNYTSYVTNYDSDGLKISGLLTKPLGEMPSQGWPAIIFVHGYIPPKTYQTTSQYSDYVDYLARNGFVIFKIDLRGHGNSEGEPSGAYYSSDYIVDVLNAYNALESSPFVNPKKIGLWGHSMAGNVVLRSMASKPTIPAVVIWAGAVYSYVDFREYGISDASYQPPQMSSERVRKRQQLLDTYGQPSEESFFWNQVAPTNYLSELKGAIQIHHAADDDVVDIAYSRNLISLLSKTSVPNEFHEYPQGGHNLTGSSFTLAMDNTIEFFRKYLDSK